MLKIQKINNSDNNIYFLNLIIDEIIILSDINVAIFSNEEKEVLIKDNESDEISGVINILDCVFCILFEKYGRFSNKIQFN